MTTLIIGCGYLGQRVAAQLIGAGDRVLGTVRSNERAAAIAALGVEPLIADVLEPHSLDALPAVDRVFYCVGYDRRSGDEPWSVGTDGFSNVLDRLPGPVRRVVYASSTGVYGQSSGEWVNESSPAVPPTESGRICLEAEKRLRAWADARSTTATATISTNAGVVLRFAGQYGPGRIVRRALLERGDPVPGDPDRFLNLIQIDDAARASAVALNARAPAPLYIVADDRPVSRLEYYTVAARALGAPAPRFEPPRPNTLEAARDATNKRTRNHLMKRDLLSALLHPDVTTGLPAALAAR